MQCTGCTVLRGHAVGQFQCLTLLESTIVIVEYKHLGTHFSGQVSVFAVTGKQQVTWPATCRQLYKRRVGGHQRMVRVGCRVVPVDKHLVCTQITGVDELAVRGGHHRVHVGGHLALRIDPAGRMTAHLGHGLQLTFSIDRQHGKAAARVGMHAVVGHKQIAPIRTQAGMSRLFTQGLDLVDEGQLIGFRVDGNAAGATDDIALALAVFIDHEQTGLVFGQGQPRRVGGLEHLQRLRGDTPFGAVKLQPVDALAFALGVGANQQLDFIPGIGLGRHCTHAQSHQHR